MFDYRLKVDDLLGEWCVNNNIEYSDIHDDAFCIKVNGEWVFIWYCEDTSEEGHLKWLKRQLGLGDDNEN